MLVQKGNRQLKVSEDKLEEFLQLGYSQIDEEGKVVQAGKAITYEDIKAENETLKSKLDEYKENQEKLDQFAEIQAENETLKSENIDLKAQLEAKAAKGK